MKNDNGGIDMVIPSALKGGTYYEIARYIAQILESDLGLKLEVTNTSGSNPNIIAVSRKEALFSFCAAAPLYEAWRGEGWSKGRVFSSLRVLFPMHTAYMHGWTIQEEPVTMSDLEGKTIGIGPVGGTAAEYLQRMIDVLIIKPMKMVHASWYELDELLMEGRVFCNLTIGGIPQVNIKELAQKTKLQVFGLSPDEMLRIQKSIPFFTEGCIPENCYMHQETAIPTLGIGNFAICHHELADNMAYEIVRTVFDHIKTTAEIIPAFNEFDKKNVLKSPIPLHEGAIRYYKEQRILP